MVSGHQKKISMLKKVSKEVALRVKLEMKKNIKKSQQGSKGFSAEYQDRKGAVVES